MPQTKVCVYKTSNITATTLSAVIWTKAGAIAPAIAKVDQVAKRDVCDKNYWLW